MLIASLTTVCVVKVCVNIEYPLMVWFVRVV